MARRARRQEGQTRKLLEGGREREREREREGGKERGHAAPPKEGFLGMPQSKPTDNIGIAELNQSWLLHVRDA